jgi:hypothetical protein
MARHITKTIHLNVQGNCKSATDQRLWSHIHVRYFCLAAHYSIIYTEYHLMSFPFPSGSDSQPHSPKHAHDITTQQHLPLHPQHGPKQTPPLLTIPMKHHPPTTGRSHIKPIPSLNQRHRPRLSLIRPRDIIPVATAELTLSPSPSQQWLLRI